MDNDESALIKAVLNGDLASFEPLIREHQARVFATVRRYARRESDVEDVVQEVFIKAYQKLHSYRAEAPFEHWLMRLTVRTCYDFLRANRRHKETTITDLTGQENDWLERFVANPSEANENAAAAAELIQHALGRLSPASRLVITLLEIEGRSLKEIAALMNWSVSLVKVRAFRARREMRKFLERMLRQGKM